MRHFRFLLPAMIGAMLLATAGGSAAGQTLPWREDQMPKREVTTITVGETELEVILSISMEEQTLGLGYRNGLEVGQGMLFPYETAQPRNYWMKGMRFCIDIIWINDGEIIGAAESVCPDPPGTDDVDRARFSSGEPVTHVLETPAGWLAEHGYGPGTPVEIPETISAEAP